MESHAIETGIWVVLRESEQIMPTVFIPAQLRELSGGTQSVELEAKNVREIVYQLDAMFPGFKDRICVDGNISPSHSVLNSYPFAIKKFFIIL